MGEFEKQLKQMNLEKNEVENIVQMICSAREEFPCLSCPSKEECNSFKWFIKWFG
jgi:hypothetical protein